MTMSFTTVIVLLLACEVAHRSFTEAHQSIVLSIQKISSDGHGKDRSADLTCRKQKNYYSGKTHRHTLKNTVIADLNRGIPVVGPTVPGRRHDFKLLKDELDLNEPGLSHPITHNSVSC